MASAEVMARAAAPTDAVVEALRDPATWPAWMPGLVAAASKGDGLAEWRLQTPAGEATFDLVFEVGADRVAFSLPPGQKGGPFSTLSGEIAVAGVEDGSDITLAMTLKGFPPPPKAMVRAIADQALKTLCARLGGHAPQSHADAPQLVHVPMSDGVSLAAHVYRAAAEPRPCLVLLIPYRKDSIFVSMLAGIFTAAGFHLVAADVRGFGGSKAGYEGLWSQREQDDFVDLIEWVVDQEFSNGAVATVGASYCAGNQLLVAARKPRGLRCIAPLVGMVDTYRDWTHRGGIPTHTNWGAGTYLRAGQLATARAGIEHYYLDLQLDPYDNDAHRARSPEYVLPEIQVPTLCVGGWHDYFLRSTIRSYLGVSGPKRLIVGPWGHGSEPPIDDIVAWYQHWLGEAAGDPPGAPVRVFITGADEWRELDDWPTPDRCEYVTLGPRAEGRLAEGKTDETIDARVVTHVEAVAPPGNPKPEFVPDPTDSGMALWGEDVTFDSEPLDRPLTVLGHPALIAVIGAECADFDVHARISAVKSDGSVVQLTEGRLRASHRAVDRERSLVSSAGEIVVPWHPHDRGHELPSGQEATLAVEIAPLGHRFDAGDRVRLGLTLTRADEESVPAPARIGRGTRLLLPRAED